MKRGQNAAVIYYCVALILPVPFLAQSLNRPPMVDRGDIVGQRERSETILPWRQIRVLLLIDLAEVTSVTVIYPFIVQLLEDSRIAHERYNVGHYVGIVEALFFLTQAVSVPQWGFLSDRIGRKPVLVMGLLGLIFTMNLFGRSKSFLAIAFSRVLMGGSIGNGNVVKSAIRELTDKSNRARAFSFLPVVWFIGSTVAPWVGGSFSDPALLFWPLFFQDDFWREHPYYLPCWMTAAFSSFCVIWALLKLYETNPRLRNSRYQPSLHSGESEIALLSIRDDHVTETLLRRAEPINGSPLPTILLSFSNDPLRLSLLNYGLLAYLDTSFRLLLPLFLATTLHTPPAGIGFLLGAMGLVNCIVQVTLFTPLHRVLGYRSLYSLGLCSLGALFATFPFFKGDQSGKLGSSEIALIVFQMALYPIAQMSFHAISSYFEDPSTSSPTIGATNGIAQTVASMSRAFGSVSSGSLFALSMQGRGLIGKSLVYYILGSVTVFAVGVSRMLPVEPFQVEVEQVQTHSPEGSA